MQIDEAEKLLQSQKLHMHHDRLKNWDLDLLHKIVAPLTRTIKAVDLGCSGLSALNFLYALGFRDLHGIDLTITGKEKRRQAALRFKSFSLKLPFHLYAGDLTKTAFPDQSFELATCISVIEHGVDILQFFIEMDRIIKPQGLLFITADYWPEKMKTADDERPCNLPYNIFSKDEILQLLDLASKYGFSLYGAPDITEPMEKNILGDLYRHTFICMVFRKDRVVS